MIAATEVKGMDRYTLDSLNCDQATFELPNFEPNRSEQRIGIVEPSDYRLNSFGTLRYTELSELRLGDHICLDGFPILGSVDVKYTSEFFGRITGFEYVGSIMQIKFDVHRNAVEIGSVSIATMRIVDVLPRVLEVIDNYDPIFSYAVRSEYAESLEELDCVDSDWDLSEDTSEDLSYLLNEELWNRMQDIVPEYCYFGSTEGDGADFGIWADIESVEEAIRYNELKKYRDLWDREGNAKDPSFVGLAALNNKDSSCILFYVTGNDVKEVWSVV